MNNFLANCKNFLYSAIVPELAALNRKITISDIRQWDREAKPDEATRVAVNAWVGENPNATKGAFFEFTRNLDKQAMLKKYPNANKL